MQLPEYKLAAAVKRQLDRVYLISGDEPFLLQQAQQLIQDSATEKGYTLGKTFHLDSAVDIGELFTYMYNSSLFGEQQLVRIVLPPTKLSTNLTKLLLEYVAEPAPDKILLLASAKITPATKKTKWFTSLVKHTTWVSIWPPNAAQFVTWLRARCQQAQLRLEPDVLEVLASRTKGNLGLAAQTIANLKHYVADKAATYQDLDIGLADHSNYQVFELIESALVGNIAQCIKIIERLKATQQPPLYLLNTLVSEANNLALAIDQCTAASNFEQVCQQLGIYKFKQTNFKQALERHNATTIASVLQLLAKSDHAIKGWLPLDPWSILGEAVLCLAGMPTPAQELLIAAD